MVKKQTKKEWVAFVSSTLDGIESHLRSSAPQKSRVQLQQFKRRATLAQTSRTRKQLEKEIDAFVESAPHLKDAANRHIADLCKPVIKILKRIVRMAQQMRAERRKQKRSRTRKSSVRAGARR